MVKNSKGGKNSKRMARKHVNEVSHKGIRYVREEGEMYATVTKHFGGQCEVVTTDGTTRLCVLRGKFKGRQRRDNNITGGSWIMVGVRDWEARADGKNKCDLLYVYNDTEKDLLKQNTNTNLTELNKVSSQISGISIDDNVEFRDDNREVYETIIQDEEKDNNEVMDGESSKPSQDSRSCESPVGTAHSDPYIFNIDEI
jgi:initiation factor 1A